MVDIVLRKKNETTALIDCAQGILQELKAKFTFYPEGYKFMKKYKLGIWDGTISLIDIRFGTIPLGLCKELITCAETLEYTVECVTNEFGSILEVIEVEYEEVESFVSSLNLHSKGNPISAREYQLKIIHECIINQRLIAISPTGSGKSLIIYSLFRWYLSKGVKTSMLVVPTIGLIKQMQSDFKDYSTHNGFEVDEHLQIVAEGSDNTITKPIILAVWQSLFRLKQDYFKSIELIVGDEIHGFTSDCTKGVFDKCINAKYRFGVTGSLNKCKLNKLVLQGIIGDIYQINSTRELIDAGYLSDLQIRCFILKYSSETKKILKSVDYQLETDFICGHERRNTFITKLALGLSGNTLVMYRFNDKHGKILYEKIKEAATTQKIYMVYGNTKSDEREAIRNDVQNSKETNIILGSSGVFATGVNLPRIHNIIFASPTKSVIKVMQSIGRGLRKSSDKDYLRLYDIADDITGKNHTYKHFIERLQIYNDEEHPYKITKVDIE